jgi:cyclopropane fatty-acyl-phospholipid synthase-like methyltransferase
MADNLASLLLSIIKSKGIRRRWSAVNRFLDYLDLEGADQKLVSLHKDILPIIEDSHKSWPHYDYGEGYFYQSYPDILIRGLRKTDFRFKFYKLEKLLNPNMRVLDIGCNAGFLSLMISRYCKHIDALELNPFLIHIAEKCREYEGVENVKFFISSFDDFEADCKYDVIFSLANHHTFDGKMRPEFRSYIEKIRSIINEGGLLIFESHPKEHKTPYLKKQIESIQDLFQIDSEAIVSTTKSVYDTNRYVAWLRAL